MTWPRPEASRTSALFPLAARIIPVSFSWLRSIFSRAVVPLGSVSAYAADSELIFGVSLTRGSKGSVLPVGS
jgi:hypothetical protein